MAYPLPSHRGPHPVGVIETEIPSHRDPIDSSRRLLCSIWYPGAPGQQERADASHPLDLPHTATADLVPLPRPCPLIIFSHGNSGYRQQSTFLTTHLASWGFLVAAPDHAGNTFEEMLQLQSDEARREVHLRARDQRPIDLLSTLHALVDAAHESHRRATADPKAIGVLGHSFGGWTALKTPALDDRVRAVCGLAPASEPFVGRKAFLPGELPLAAHVRSLVIAAQNDVLVDQETSIAPLFRRLGPAAQLEVLPDADHFHFCDGLELLHRMHETQPRPGQLHPTRPLAELMSEAKSQEWLKGHVADFFLDILCGENS